MAFPITIVYWLAIWPTDKIEGAYNHFLNVEVHGMTLLSLLTDFFLSSFLFKRDHFKYIAAVTLIYLIMNLTVTLVDKPVYPVINWKDSISYVFGAVAVLLSIGSFKIFSKISYKRYLKL